MQKFFGILGWILSVLGIVSILLCFLVLLENSERHKDAPYGFAMFGIVFGLPGGIILWQQRSHRQERTFRSQLLGYVKSLDSFTADELAQKIGRSAMETEGLIVALIEREKLDLAFHRKSRKYMHRKRLKTGHKLLTRCPSCGAAIGNQIVFEGEDITCQYCEHSLLSAPPASTP